MADSSRDQQGQDKENQQQQQQQQEEKDKKSNSQTPRYEKPRPHQPKPPRHNKLYRTPPTPTREELLERECSFVLDSKAMSSISLDYSRANPKFGSVLPTYNAQRDSHTGKYFRFRGVPEVLKQNLQSGAMATSIEGRKHDEFKETGPGHRYLASRAPCGYSNEERMGHNKDMWKDPFDDEQPKEEGEEEGEGEEEKEKEKGEEESQEGKSSGRGPDQTARRVRRVPRELEGYNGPFGYRRTTPALRKFPSQFGVNTDTPIYEY